MTTFEVRSTHEQEVEHQAAETRAKVETLGTVHVSDIDALKEIVIGLTARVNELEFATRKRSQTYIPSLFFHPRQNDGH